MLTALAQCGKGKLDSHACRNLHGLIKRKGKLLQVNISYMMLQKRLSRRKLVAVEMPHPLLKLSDWARTIFQHGGHFFMKGHSLDSVRTFKEELHTFWVRYAKADPTHPFFRAVPNQSEWDTYIPIAIHGDEGRGRQKQPVMIISYQPLLPIKEEKSTMKKYLGLDKQNLRQ